MTDKWAWVTAKAIALYMYNKSFDHFMGAVFPDIPADDAYYHEWSVRWRGGFGVLFGALAFLNQQKFLSHVLRTYGSEAEKQWDILHRMKQTQYHTKAEEGTTLA